MLQHVSKVSFEEGTYILEGILAQQNSRVCFSDSNMMIKSYDVETSNHIMDITGHTHPITDMSTMNDGNTLVSSQRDTGVMISDLRTGQGEHFLTELTGTKNECCSVSVSNDDTLLAVAVNGDIEIVDTRTWNSVRTLAEVHMDEISRVRFCGDNEICSAGEDHMINFYDLRNRKDKDVMVSMINCGEVITKMNCFPGQAAVGMVGSCENAYLAPLDLSMERKFERPNFETYMCDFANTGENLVLVGGDNDFETGIGPLHVFDAFTMDEMCQLKGCHKDIVRVVLGIGNNKLITAGEDGVVGFWSLGEDEEPASAQGKNLKEKRVVPEASKMLKKKRAPY